MDRMDREFFKDIADLELRRRDAVAPLCDIRDTAEKMIREIGQAFDLEIAHLLEECDHKYEDGTPALYHFDREMYPYPQNQADEDCVICERPVPGGKCTWCLRVEAAGRPSIEHTPG